MLHLCIFGGYEGPLSPEKKCCFTLFGACELRRPTLARQLISAQQIRDGHVSVPKLIFVTIFGNTEIHCPTLTEEFLDLREAIASGALAPDKWDFYIAELDRWHSSATMALTLFANFSESVLPKESEEIESLALQRHLGHIDADSGRILEMGIGQSGAQRRAVIRQAVAG